MLLDNEHPYDCSRQHKGEVGVKCLNNEDEVTLKCFDLTMTVTKDTVDEFIDAAQAQGDIGQELPFYVVCEQSGLCPNSLFTPDVLTLLKYYRYCNGSMDRYKPHELDEQPNIFVDAMGLMDSEINKWSEIRAKKEAQRRQNAKKVTK